MGYKRFSAKIRCTEHFIRTKPSQCSATCHGRFREAGRWESATASVWRQSEFVAERWPQSCYDPILYQFQLALEG